MLRRADHIDYLLDVMFTILILSSVLDPVRSRNALFGAFGLNTPAEHHGQPAEPSAQDETPDEQFERALGCLV